MEEYKISKPEELASIFDKNEIDVPQDDNLNTEDIYNEEENQNKESIETEDTSKNTEDAVSQDNQDVEDGNADDDKEEPKETGQEGEPIYDTFIKDLIEEGEWEDETVETEEGEEVLLSEMKEVDKKTFYEIKRQKDKLDKQNTISLDSFDESKRKLVEILKEGGDLKEYFSSPKELEEPFKGVDLEDENNQKAILYNFNLNKGLDEEESKNLVEMAEKNGTLQEKTEKVTSFFKEKHQEKIKEAAAKAKEKREQEQKEDKELKKTLKEKFTSLGYNDSKAKIYADKAIKKDSEGNYEIDKVYEERMKDPEKAYKLIQLLIDEDNFMKHIKEESKTATQKDNMRKLKLAGNKSKKTTGNRKRETENQELIDTLNTI